MGQEELIAALAELTVRLGELTLRVRAQAIVAQEQAVTFPAMAAALPPRLQQVLASLLRGRSEKEIAGELHLSIHTVHSHVKALHRTFGVTTRAELMSLWIRWEPQVHTTVATVPGAGVGDAKPPPAVLALKGRRLRTYAGPRG